MGGKAKNQVSALDWAAPQAKYSGNLEEVQVVNSAEEPKKKQFNGSRE